ILAGLEDPDRGEIARRRGSRVEYLAQEPVLPEGLSILEVTLRGLKEWSAAKATYDEVSAQLAAGVGSLEELLERQERAAAEVERLGGWERSNEAGAVLSR